MPCGTQFFVVFGNAAFTFGQFFAKCGALRRKCGMFRGLLLFGLRRSICFCLCGIDFLHCRVLVRALFAVCGGFKRIKLLSQRGSVAFCFLEIAAKLCKTSFGIRNLFFKRALFTRKAHRLGVQFRNNTRFFALCFSKFLRFAVGFRGKHFRLCAVVSKLFKLLMKAHFGFNGISVRCFGVLKRGAAACGSGVGGVAVRLRLAQSLFKLGIHGIAAVALRLALVKKALRSSGNAVLFVVFGCQRTSAALPFAQFFFGGALIPVCIRKGLFGGLCGAFRAFPCICKITRPALCAFGSGSIAMNGANLLSANRQLAGKGNVDKFSGMLGVDEFFNFQ